MSLFHHRTFTHLQITLRLHFPSFTAPTQLSTIITLAPVHYHPITHTLYKPWTFCHTLPSIVLACLHTKRFPCISSLISWFLPVFLVHSLCLALWIKFADRRPTLALGLLLCLAHAIPVCSCPTLPVLTMFFNKKLAFGSECLTSRHPRHNNKIKKNTLWK